MESKKHYYETIKGVLSQIAKLPYNKEEVKVEIVKSIKGYDYISAVTDYLWGAYCNSDPSVKAAFDGIFSDDLYEYNPELFHFFSFCFSNDFLRRGFDRRLGNDQRKAHSLDFHENGIERRSGKERRRKSEKRLNWTRITDWVSVPFKLNARRSTKRHILQLQTKQK